MKKKFLNALISLSLATAICLLASCSSSENDNSAASVQEVESSEVSIVSTTDESAVSTSEELTKENEVDKKIRNYFSEQLFSNEFSNFKTALMYGISAEGALVRGYYHDNDLKLIKIKAYGETGRWFLNFYLIDSETIFVVDDKQEYSTAIALAEPEDIYVKKECTKAYVILEGKEYEYDSNKMVLVDESEASLKELFDKVLSFLNSDDFVDEPTRW